MSAYLPPRQFLSIFNPIEYEYSEAGLTLATADARYLKKTGGILTGLLSANAGVQSSGVVNVSNTTESTNTSTGAIITAGGVGITKSCHIGDQLHLIGATSTLRLPAGSATNPSCTFTGNLNTGIYRIGTDNLGLTCGGVKQIDISTATTTFTNPIVAPAVSQAYVFSGATTTGMGTTGANRIGFYSANSLVLQLNNGGANDSRLPLSMFSLGTAAAPQIINSNATTTGLYWETGPLLSVSVGGVKTANFESGGMRLYGSTAGNNALYTPSLLSYYEEFSLSGSWYVNGTGTGGAASTVYLTRIGRMMYITINQFGDGSTNCINNTGVNQTEIYYSLSIPTRALSTITQQSATFRVFWGTTFGSVIAFFYITAGGVIRGGTIANTGLPNGQCASMNTPFTISYPIV
jgi:hypothetical protein